MTEISDIVSRLILAKDAYYNSGTPIMSDAEFDSLEAKLRDIDPINSYFLAIGSEVRGEKVPLPVTMGSLDQFPMPNGATDWVKANNLENTEFVITDKLDGLSVLLVYGNDGNLQIAFTRGDGRNGHDVTRHVRKMKNVPQRISQAYMIRAEILMPKSAFEELNSSGKLGREFKNARNYSAGQMNRHIADQVFYDNACVVAYELKGNLDKEEQLRTLQSNGFHIPNIHYAIGASLTDDYLKHVLEIAKNTSPFELDGLVVDVDFNIDREKLGDKPTDSLNPNYARKFKLNSDDNLAITDVVAVHWNVSKHGYMKPRVEVKPVELVGVTVTFASGFNAGYIRDNKIGPGAKISIARSGDVIPDIQNVLVPANDPDLPAEDEYGSMHWSTSGVDLILDEDHEDAKFKRLLGFFAGIRVDLLRSGNMIRLNEAGFDDAVKIIKASKEDIEKAVGVANGAKIYEGIHKALSSVEFSRLAAASNLFGRGIGYRRLSTIESKFGAENFWTITLADLLSVNGFSETTANLILEGRPKLQKFLGEIDGYYALKEEEKPSGTSLSGLEVVFTGIRDKDLEKKIFMNGGKIGSGVGKNTTHLVAKDITGNSSKLQKARDVGVKVISIDEARKMWS